MQVKHSWSAAAVDVHAVVRLKLQQLGVRPLAPSKILLVCNNFCKPTNPCVNKWPPNELLECFLR